MKKMLALLCLLAVSLSARASDLPPLREAGLPALRTSCPDGCVCGCNDGAPCSCAVTKGMVNARTPAAKSVQAKKKTPVTRKAVRVAGVRAPRNAQNRVSAPVYRPAPQMPMTPFQGFSGGPGACFGGSCSTCR